MTNESRIEQDLIDKLVELKYTYRADIRDGDTLKKNFRDKFDELNKVKLSDGEFGRLLDIIISGDVFACSKRLRERNTFDRDDGTPLHFTLVNIKEWCKNTFEVVNQLRINNDNSFQRYDVIILMNGLPVVQIELKTLTINPKRAIEQIIDYKSEPGNGYGKTLLCFIQLFIVSNKSDTWYFANNARHFVFNADENFLPLYQLANEVNKKITHLDEFTKNFLEKCTLGAIISRYMVLVVSEQKLMMMRPYQIYAVKAIVDCIEQNKGNGYIWHTTGSGKTLTSFKASTLLKDNPNIYKCIFVVDRKDLDKQTRDEFNKFQEGCVEENTNTWSLVRRLLSEDYADKVIVTTIQKLGLALGVKEKRKNYIKDLEPLKDKRFVFIFDECHRSQFGENHKRIKEFFPKSQLFGFTGTPIFPKNSTYRKIDGQEAALVTTEDIFQKQLHAYTITNAIEDRNVLRFYIEYFRPPEGIEWIVGTPSSRKAIVKAILEKHDGVTADRKFNGILATASINEAIDYYRLFKEIQTERFSTHSDYMPLNIACVFSPPAMGNQDTSQLQEDLPQEQYDNKIDPEEKANKLKEIIIDYNNAYGTNHDINNFDLYYQDIQKRIKDQQYTNEDYPHKNKIDIVIVVDMLLTGFDSKYLKVLYVDKALKYHGLIQAFSRTNRVLNDTKPYGNIIDFRNKREQVDEAVLMFSGLDDKDKGWKIWLVDDAPTVIRKFSASVNKLENFMANQGLSCSPEEVSNIKGNEARAEFINIFKEVQRLRVQLSQYTDLTPENMEEIEATLQADTLKGFRGMYMNIAARVREERDIPGNKKEDILQDTDFELALFSSTIIDYDYIMKLISSSTGPAEPYKRKMTKEELISLIGSEPKFIEEREELAEYINSLDLNVHMSVDEIRKGYERFKSNALSRQLTAMAKQHSIDADSLKGFVEITRQRKVFNEDLLTDLFVPLDLDWVDRDVRERALMADLAPVLRKLEKGQDISGLSAYEQS